MTRIRMIAADLDDTLLNDRLEVSPRTREVLRQAAGLGVAVTVATGRMYRSALPYALGLGIEVPIITYQGALVKNAVSGDVLVNCPVPLEAALRVVAAGYRAGVHMNIYYDDELYMDSITPEGTGYAKLARVEPHPVGNLLDFMRDMEEGPTKVIYIADPAVIDRLGEELRQAFAGTLYVTKSKPNYLEFLAGQATKGQALARLAMEYGISREEIIAFGDSYNDIDMIEYAGLGVAMGNAPEEVKRKARYVTATNNDEGVAEAVERFVLLGRGQR